MIYNDIVASSGKVAFTEFGGINRRVRGNVGEFSDMENFCHEEYPCLQSARGVKDMGFDLSEGVEAVKMIIPKRTNSEMTGFSGVVKRGEHYEIFINGVSKRSDITRFTDAVDYNGSIIVLPELKGVNYLTGAQINPVSLRSTMYFYNNYTTEYADSLAPEFTLTGWYGDWFRNTFSKQYKAGDYIILSDLTGNFAKNNTIFPASSTDYTDITSPVTIQIVSISTGGGEYSLSVTVRVKITNARGEIIGWPKGMGSSSTSNGPTDSTTGRITKYYPQSDCGCVAHNRLWLCSQSGEEIHASALGSPFEFYKREGIASDSWDNLTGTPGKFTGITTWENRVFVFKPDIIHIVYGDASFDLAKTYTVGCIDGGSIAEVGGMLMWLYYDGFYTYSGNRPRRISDKLHTKYVSCKAFSDGRRYYARCVKANGSGEFLIYDSELNLWSRISDIEVVTGDYWGGKVYLSDKTRLYVLGEGEYGDFYAETPELTFDSFMDKSVMYITVRCKIQKGFLNIYTSVNNGEWVPHKGIDKTGKHKLPIRYNPGDILRLRLEGSGNVCITEMELEVVTKGGS